MRPDELLRVHRGAILRIARDHGAANVRVFGSVARGEARPDSDVDLLVEMEASRSLLDHTALWQDLEALLGGKVDVVSDQALHPRMKEQVLAEARPL